MRLRNDSGSVRIKLPVRSSCSSSGAVISGSTESVFCDRSIAVAFGRSMCCSGSAASLLDERFLLRCKGGV